MVRHSLIYSSGVHGESELTTVCGTGGKWMSSRIQILLGRFLLRSQKEAFLIDIDGVLYVGENAIPGSHEAIKFLEGHGCSFRLVSNTTRLSRASVALKLSGMGFTIPESKIFTPAVAVADYMSRSHYQTAYLLTTDEVAGEISASGRIRHDPESAQVVVIGDAADRFTYAGLNTAFRLLLRGADLVALERDRSWRGADGMMLSAGPFVAALEFATRKEARVMGKPSPAFFRSALLSLGVQASQAVMIGDDIETDIGGAISCGMTGILVRTGKFRKETLDHAMQKPSVVLDSIADLPDYLGSLPIEE
jgi:HAD superfamily hydrolase (TIGR01458 family)